MAKKKEVTKVETKVFASASRAADNNYSVKDILPIPDTILERLGEDQYEAYKSVASDDHVHSVMETREAAVKMMNWKIVQGDASDDVFDFTESNFNNLDIDEFISHILIANAWGMSIIEPIWDKEITPGKLIVSELRDHPARWFRFNHDGKLLFLSKSAPFYGEEVPDDRVLLPRNSPTSDNPYGIALFSLCYWPVFFKKNGMKWWNKLIEKYGFPYLIGESVPNMSEEDTDELLEKLVDFVQDGVGVFPDISKVELKDPPSASKAEMFDSLITFMNGALSKIWLGNNLSTELPGNVGSRAASQTGKEVQDERIKSDQKMIEKTATQLCKWMCDKNFGVDEIPCTFQLEPPVVVSKELAERDAILSQSMGVKWTKAYISSAHHVNEDDFEIVEKEEPEEEPKNEPEEKEELSQNLDKDLLFQSVRFKDQASLDAGIDSLSASNKTLKISNTLIKPIQKFINESDNFEEAIKGLAGVFTDMETKELEDVLTTALLVSNTNGHLGAKAKT